LVHNAPKGASFESSTVRTPASSVYFATAAREYGPAVRRSNQHEVEIPRGQELTPGLWKKLGFSGGMIEAYGKEYPRMDELDGAVVNVELLRYPRGGASPTGASLKYSAGG